MAKSRASSPAGIAFEALAFRVKSTSASSEGWRQRASQAVEQTLGAGWHVQPLAAGHPEFLARRTSGKRPSPAQAWDLARQLAAITAVQTAEPLFAAPGLTPDPKQLNQLLTADERARREQTHRKPPRHTKSSALLPCSNHSEWSLDFCGVKQAWALTQQTGVQPLGVGIVIGHPDTGYTTHHEIWDAADLRILTSHGWNYVDDTSDPRDPLTGEHPSHGTSTASVIMSDQGGPTGNWVSGVAPRAALVPLRVSDSVIHFSFANVTQALYRAADVAGAHLVSMSLGGPFPSEALERAIDHALGRGLIVLAAAGNVWPWVVYPARYDPVIAVAANNCATKPWSGSASGAKVDITAPGESVWRALTQKTATGLKYLVERSSGTSYAVATAAGACALWLGHHGRDQLVQRYGAGKLAAVFLKLLQKTAHVPSGWDKSDYGAGILDVDKLLSAPLPAKLPRPKSVASTRSTVRRERFDGRVAELFPDLDADRALHAVEGMFAMKSPRAKAAFGQVDHEILFHLATTPALRTELRRRNAAKPTRGAKSVSSPNIAASQLLSSLMNR